MPGKATLAARGLFNCTGCNRPKKAGSFPDMDVKSICLKCAYMEVDARLFKRTCLRCEGTFTTRNKFYRICFSCKDAPDFKEHADSVAELCKG